MIVKVKFKAVLGWIFGGFSFRNSHKKCFIKREREVKKLKKGDRQYVGSPSNRGLRTLCQLCVLNSLLVFVGLQSSSSQGLAVLLYMSLYKHYFVIGIVQRINFDKDNLGFCNNYCALLIFSIV